MVNALALSLPFCVDAGQTLEMLLDKIGKQMDYKTATDVHNAIRRRQRHRKWFVPAIELVTVRHWADPRCPLYALSDPLRMAAVNTVLEKVGLKEYKVGSVDTFQDHRAKFCKVGKGQFAPIQDGSFRIVENELELVDAKPGRRAR